MNRSGPPVSSPWENGHNSMIQSAMLNEVGGILYGGAQGSGIVEQSHSRAGTAGGREPGERALAGLTRAVDQHHPGVRERFVDECLSAAGNEV
jgi:hypothetical protein